MQTSVDKIAKWSGDNYMNMNISKTNGMIINVARSSLSAAAALKIGDCRIKFHRLSCSVLQHRPIFVGAATHYALKLASPYTF
jgi:hypothetical protein